MNKNLLFAFITLLAFSGTKAQSQDPVLMKINNRPVTKSEFEYLYHKNNTSVQQSLEDYLKLFVDYKLKVEEAMALGMDTTKSFVTEYNGYKNQITQPYLTDTVSELILAKREYDRLGENIETSHILVRFEQKGLLPKDTLAAYEKALSIREKLFAKKPMSFEQAAKEYSEDPSANMSERPGYLGWATAMTFVSPFEDAMYAAKTGEITMPVRSMFGYHIIKVHNRKPDSGKVKVAHIMFSYPQKDATKAEKDSVKKVADDVYAKLLAGGKYEDLCMEYSSDQGSAGRGGSLGWVRIGMGLPSEFLDTAYTLKDTGDISKPISTTFGYHIIKLEDRAPRDSWEESKGQLVGQLKRGDLVYQLTSLGIQRLAEENQYKVDESGREFILSLANNYLPNDSVFISTLQSSEKELLDINGKKYTVKDFSEYLPTANSRFNVSTDYVSKALEGFIFSKLKDSHIASLGNKYPEYRNLLKEYHDGILLFNVMNEQVWENAATDTLGLINYFKANNAKYKWDSPKYKGNIVYCKDENTMKAAQKLVKKYKGDDLNNYLKAELNNDSVSFVFARKGIWGKGDNKFVDVAAFKLKEAPEPMKDYPLYFVTGKMLSAPEDYLDVKGLVISDLQEQKEKEWLEKLRSKYQVEINDAVLSTIK